MAESAMQQQQQQQQQHQKFTKGFYIELAAFSDSIYERGEHLPQISKSV